MEGKGIVKIRLSLNELVAVERVAKPNFLDHTCVSESGTRRERGNIRGIKEGGDDPVYGASYFEKEGFNGRLLCKRGKIVDNSHCPRIGASSSSQWDVHA